MAESTKGKDEELEWVMLRQEIKQSNPPMESLKEKIIRKTKANPLVPVGCLLTVVALSYGLYSMKSGNIKASQNMMRLRVTAQGATVFALIGGLLIGFGR